MSTTFAVSGSDKRSSVPWNLVEAHRESIEAAIGIPLERINAKGGLPMVELAEAIEGDDGKTFNLESAETYVDEMITSLKSSGGLSVKHLGKLVAAFALAASLLSSGDAKAQAVGGSASISVTSSSANVALPANKSNYPAVLITPTPDTTQEVFYALGDVTVAAVTTGPALPGGGICVNAGPNTYVAAITATGTATVRITQLTTCPIFARAGSSGGTPGSGTVTSVGLSLPSIFAVTGSPVTTAGTLAATLNTQAANLIWAGPTTGAPAAPAFRSLVTADLPSVSCALLPALTGDITTSAGSCATTLATVNSNVGSFGSSTSIPSFTVNAKGLITAASGNVVIAPAGTLTGATLAANVLASSLTSVGTLTNLTIGAGSAITSSGPGGALGSNAFNSTAYLPLTGGTLTGQLVVNLNAAGAPTPATGTGVQLVGTDATIARYEADSFGAISAFTCRRANGTGASPTAIASGDQICGFNIAGYYVTGGPAYSGPQASVQGFATQNWTSANQGTKVVISTTPNNSTTLTTALTIDQDQSLTAVGNIVGPKVAIGGATIGSNALAVTGTVAISGAYTNTQSIAAVSTDSLVLQNTTAATNGTQQWSPRLHWTGQGWKTTATAASQTVDWIAELVPVQSSTTPANWLVFSAQVNGLGYSPYMTLKYDLVTATNNSIQFGNPVDGGAGHVVHLLPSNDGAGTIGNSSSRWASVFAFTNFVIGTNTFITSPSAGVLQHGAADVASGAVAQFIRAQSNTGASTTGPDFTIQSTKGTLIGGSLIFQTAATTTYATVLTLSSAGNATFAGSVNLGVTGAVFIAGSVALSSVQLGDIIGINSGRIGFVSGSAPTASPDTVITRAAAASLRLGNVDAAAPVAQTLRVQSVVAGNANTAGVPWTLIGSLSNGNGVGGDIIFQTSLNNAASGTQNTAATALTLSAGTQNATFTGLLVTSSTTDATAAATGSLQTAGGASIAKRVFLSGLTASAGLQTAVLCLSSANEVIADSVACLASTEKAKRDIVPLDIGLAAVMALEPIWYRYSDTGNERFDSAPNHRALRAGFRAEQAFAVDPRLAALDANGRVRTVMNMDAIFAKAIQELKADNDNLRAELRRIAR